LSEVPPDPAGSPGTGSAIGQPLLFTTDLVTGLAQRYSAMPEHLRPLLLQHATDPQHSTIHEWLEWHLRKVDPSVRAGFLSRLRTEDLYPQALAELATAHVVDRPGYSIEYEPVIDGLTPDLRLTDPTGHHLLIEVWRRGLPKATAKRNAGRAQLARAVRGISVPVAIAVDAADADAINPPDDAERKPVVASLKRRLTTRERLHGRLWLPHHNQDLLVIGRFRFRVVGTTRTGRTELLPVMDGVSMRRDDVVHAVESKVKKYRGIAERYDMPLLVVLGGDDGAIMTRQLVEEILDGHNPVAMAIPPWGGGFIDSGPIEIRRTAAPPIFDAALSKIGSLDIRDGAHARIDLMWDNPRAARPVQAITADHEI